MAEFPALTRSELILGGQKSGKSRRAEQAAHTWLAQSAEHKAVLIATAQPWDEEMAQRIARHQSDRARRVPGLRTLEEPLAVAQAISRCSDAKTMVIVDCLTLWLTNLLMPPPGYQGSETGSQDTQKYQFTDQKGSVAQYPRTQTATLLVAIKNAAGPLILVGNEIGLGVIPLGRETRAFVDALGQLNQQAAGACGRVTLMVAGLPLILKDAS